MSLIEKIDAEIDRVSRIPIFNDCTDTDEIFGEGKKSGWYEEAVRIKETILSEQKEPCGWCKENYRFEFNWIDKDGNTVTTGDHMVIGGIADYCPVCGRPLNQPYTDR